MFPLGTTTVACTATDTHGNAGSASFTVTVTFTDTTGPTFTVVPSPITAEATSPAGAVVPYTITATDNSGATPTIDCAGHGSGSTFPLGPTTVTCTASDGTGNTATASFLVTVQDTTAPQLNRIEYRGRGGLNSRKSMPTSERERCGIRLTDRGAALRPARRCARHDDRQLLGDRLRQQGNGSFGVTVADTIGPAFSGVPANLQVEANGPAGSIVNYTPPTATDATDGPEVVTCNPASGSTFSLGTTTVTCRASDAEGHTSSALFSVLVVDTTKPTLIVPADRAIYADTPTASPDRTTTPPSSSARHRRSTTWIHTRRSSTTHLSSSPWAPW
jgi:hypothetical protein